MAKLVAYLFAGIPAVIGIGFVARYSFATSDDLLTGASSAFLYGMLAAGAFAGPAFALSVYKNGWKLAGWILGLLSLLAILGNWSQTLGAIAHRGAGTEAVNVKAKADLADMRAALKRLEMERGAMSFTAATSDNTVASAREAVAAAERTRLAECGPNNEKRGIRCRDREGEVQTKRDALTAALSNKDATDKAAKLDASIATIRLNLGSASPPKETNSLGEALGRLLHLEAATAATAQQAFVSAIVELLIAAALALPELLAKPKASTAQHEYKTPAPLTARRDNVLPMISRTKTPPPPVKVGDVDQFMLEGVTKGSKSAKVSWAELYIRYRTWCDGNKVVPVDAKAFGARLDILREELGLRVRTRGNDVYFLELELAS